MEKGGRLKVLFDNIDKICIGKSPNRIKDDDISQLRYFTQRLLGAVEGPQEKSSRESIVKNSAYMTTLLTTLQVVNDRYVHVNVVRVIMELLGKANSGRRASVLVQHGAIHALFHVLILESKEGSPGDDFMILLHQILYKLGLKDRKFGTKARLCHALPVTLNLIRQQAGVIGSVAMSSMAAKNLQALLNLFRLYCNNQQNASSMGRNGAVNFVFRIVVACGKKNLSLLKTSLDALTNLVKSKSNSARAIGQNGVPVLLDLFLDWCKSDTRNRQVPLRKSILSVLKNLTNLRSGRRALLEHNGLHALYEVCETSKSKPELEAIVTLASGILRKCFPRNRLPLASYTSVLRCPLPYGGAGDSKPSSSSGRPVEIREVGPAPSLLRPTNESRRFPIEFDVGGEDSPVDEDDDVSSGDDIDDEGGFYTKLTAGKTSGGNGGVGSTRRGSRSKPSMDSSGGLYDDTDIPVYSAQYMGNRGSERNLEELLRDYDHFYPELTEFSQFPGSQDSITSQPAESVWPGSRTISGSTNLQVPESGSRRKSELHVDRLPKSTSSPAFISTGVGLDQAMRMLGLADKRLCGPGSGPTSSSSSGSGGRLDPEEGSRPSGAEHALSGSGSSPVCPSCGGRRSSGSSGVGSSASSQTKMDSSLAAHTTEFNANNVDSEVSKSRTTRRLSSGVNAQTSGWSRDATQCRVCSGGKSDEAGPSNQGGGDAQVDEKEATTEPTEKSPTEEFNDDGLSEHTANYVRLSSRTRSLGRFTMLGYPDLIGFRPPTYREPFFDRSSNGGDSGASVNNLQQNKILEDLRRVVDQNDLLDRVVFDLDQIVQERKTEASAEYSELVNEDEIVLDRVDYRIGHLLFDSQFESGNLRKAVQVRQFEYDLMLSPDVNANHHAQWFYFRVANVEARVPYRFNIVNCEKPNSQFNFGMKPLMFSVKEAVLGKPQWRRVGTQICYYKNHFARSSQTTGGVPGRSYFTTTFVISFQHDGDVCYLAYHYPYTYTHLLTDIEMWSRTVADINGSPQTDVNGATSSSSPQHGQEAGGGETRYAGKRDSIKGEEGTASIYFRVQNLCSTLLGNDVPVLTITATPKNQNHSTIEQFRLRPYIFLSSRVHPGESNSSWVMRGTISALLARNPIARALREAYIFKIIPMLNPDGVLNGNHRCSMAAEDLNRKWLEPCPKLFPTIYHAKGLLMYMTKTGRTPLVYCDYHGHSRKKNVFMYGCSPSLSWMSDDSDNPAYVDSKTEDTAYKALPRLLHGMAPAFSIANCCYAVDKAKESTARVVVWRQCRVLRSYTMESSYCGCDQGPYRGFHISTRELEEMGAKFAEAMLRIRSRPGAAAPGETTQLTSTQISASGEVEGAAGGGPRRSLGRERQDDELDEEEDACESDLEAADSDGDDWSENSDNCNDTGDYEM